MSTAAARPGPAGCSISPTSPRATTRQPGGRARRRTHRFYEGCPRAALWSGCARSTRCHTAPACKIVGDPVIPVRSLVEKHLIQNQMFDSRQTSHQSRDQRVFPIYISWYTNGYGRPWTLLDMNPKMGHVHGQFAGSEEVLLPTTDHMVIATFPVK
jgi:hypothetical protein